MYKNQLQELAQRSCFNLPSYTCIREGPDHAPRFKAIANFNGETFESPNYFSTLRQAEHAAAEVALNSLSTRGPSHSLAARILDETGVYKNLLQEIAQRVGAPLPKYGTYRSGLGHQPVFTGIVDLAGIAFTGEPAKNKKQAEKNAAMAAWSSLKQLAQQEASSSSDAEQHNEEQEQIRIARALLNYRLKEKMNRINSHGPIPFQNKFLNPRPSNPQPPQITTSKILPLIYPKTGPTRIGLTRPVSPNDPNMQRKVQEAVQMIPQIYNIPITAGATPYVPYQNFRPSAYRSFAPPVTIRTAVPVFSAPPVRSTGLVQQTQPVRIAPPVSVRQVVPVFATPSARKDDLPAVVSSDIAIKSTAEIEPSETKENELDELEAVKDLEKLKV
jgi:hypothetical protein